MTVLDPAPPIASFTGHWHRLSSFAAVPFQYWFPGTGLATAATREHAFQALKCSRPEEAARVLSLNAAAEAKRVGRQVALREDWEQAKRAEMLSLILAQAVQQPSFRDFLLSTEDAVLIEGNTWGDSFWGAVRPGDRGYSSTLPVWTAGEHTWWGHNWLGRCLMGARSVLQ